jgi:diadenosine tetraphosphatase ApaH/serine/threonine PP2A family protein phosphatase
MRVAVISDVHANYQALEAVLKEIDAARVDAVWCLGDTVGYGPRPNECCDVVRDRAAYSLVGNHDLVVLGDLELSEFNDEAAAAAIWTSEVLTAESRAFLASLKPSGEVEGVDLFHASARDPVWEYVLTEEAARGTLELSSAQLILVGHSHVALAITADDGRVGGGPARGGSKIRLDGRRLLNPGSVGQPRDGDPRAAWMLLDLEGRFAEFRRVPYSIERTQAEMREQGLPPALASRLQRGE